MHTGQFQTPVPSRRPARATRQRPPTRTEGLAPVAFAALLRKLRKGLLSGTVATSPRPWQRQCVRSQRRGSPHGSG